MIWKMNKVELYWLSSFIRAAPCKEVCGWEAPCLFMPDSPNRVRGPNDLWLGALTCKVGVAVKEAPLSPWLRNTRSYSLMRLCRVDRAF